VEVSFTVGDMAENYSIIEVKEKSKPTVLLLVGGIVVVGVIVAVVRGLLSPIEEPVDDQSELIALEQDSAQVGVLAEGELSSFWLDTDEEADDVIDLAPVVHSSALSQVIEPIMPDADQGAERDVTDIPSRPEVSEPPQVAHVPKTEVTSSQAELPPVSPPEVIVTQASQETAPMPEPREPARPAMSGAVVNPEALKAAVREVLDERQPIASAVPLERKAVPSVEPRPSVAAVSPTVKAAEPTVTTLQPEVRPVLTWRPFAKEQPVVQRSQPVQLTDASLSAINGFLSHHGVPPRSSARLTVNEASLFCQWLTQEARAQGRLRSGEHYRLPFASEDSNSRFWHWGEKSEIRNELREVRLYQGVLR